LSPVGQRRPGSSQPKAPERERIAREAEDPGGSTWDLSPGDAE
jgi:hypothetical protein